MNSEHILRGTALANLSYNEIRETWLPRNYEYKFLGKHALWIEVYEDTQHEYRALFTPNSLNLFPITITKQQLDELRKSNYC